MLGLRRGKATPRLIALLTVSISLASETGFSRKSAAPRRVASTCGIDGAVAGHHHDRHGELAAARPFLQQRHPIGVRHPDVEQHQVRTLLDAESTRRLGVLRQMHVVPLIGQDLRQQLTNAHFVIDDENMPAHACSPDAAKTGSAMWMAAPPVLRFSICILP
jgi:hypothetical protein